MTETAPHYTDTAVRIVKWFNSNRSMKFMPWTELLVQEPESQSTFNGITKQFSGIWIHKKIELKYCTSVDAVTYSL